MKKVLICMHVLLGLIGGCNKPPDINADTTVSLQAALITPISNAHYRISYLRNNSATTSSTLSSTSNEILGEGKTDKEGRLETKLTNAEGTLLIEVLGDQGGISQEPISNDQLALSPSDRLMAIIPEAKLAQKYDHLIVSPWSTLIAARTLWSVRNNQKSYTDAFKETNDLFIELFAGQDFINALPVDPSAASTNGLSSSALHGLATTALTAAGDELSRSLGLTPGGLVNLLSLTQMLTDDLLADGRFDGNGTKGFITLVDDQRLDIELTRKIMAAALGSYLTSQANKSGVRLSDMTATITAISTNYSVLYGDYIAGSPKISTKDASQGPIITLSSPVQDAVYRDKISIIGFAESEAGVTGVEILIDDRPISSGQRLSNNKIAWTEESKIDDGFHNVKIVAHDAFGKESKVTTTFSVDSTAPKISFSDCKAYDDGQRGFEVKAQYSTIRWYNAVQDFNCKLEALQPQKDKPYFIFRTFAELAKELETSSFISVIPSDADGKINTASEKLSLTAGIYQYGRLIGNIQKIPATPGQTIRDIYLSSKIFGPDFLELSGQVPTELRLIVRDTLGNENTLSLFFKLDILPTPLGITPESIEPNTKENIEHYSFETNNLPDLVSPNLGLENNLFVVKRYNLKNISDRDTVFSISGWEQQQVQVQLKRWQGLVAGHSTHPPASNWFSYGVSLPDNIKNCYTRVSGDVWPFVAQDWIKDNVPVIVSTNDEAPRCVGTNDFLAGGITKNTAVNWRIVVIDTASHQIVDPAGSITDYVIPAGKNFQVLIGFDQPHFDAESVNFCKFAYGIPVKLTTYTAAHAGINFTPMPLFAPGGIFDAREMYTPDALGDPSLHWSGTGYVDCLGVNCGFSGCYKRPDSTNQLRGHYAVMIFRGAKDDDYYVQSISRMFVEHSLTLGGHITLKPALRLPTNEVAHDYLLRINDLDLNLNFTRINPNPPPDHLIRYTKSNL